MSLTIDTERLHLRPFVDDDAEALLDLMGRPEVARWSGTGQPMADLDAAHTWIASRTDRAGDLPGAGVFALVPRDAGRPMGMALLVPLPPSEGNPRSVHEIGWHVHPDVWRRGLAFEAGSAMVRRAVEAGLDEVWAVTKPDNTPSQGVCLKLGMTDLGLTDDWYDQRCRTFRLDLAAGS